MQKLFLFLALIFNFFLLKSQNIIVKVINSNNSPIQNCKLFLDNKLIGLTNIEGVFVINNTENFFKAIKFTHIGYKINILDFKQLKNYNEIILRDSNYLLKGVSVKLKNYNKYLVGNKSNKQKYLAYTISNGGKIGSAINLPFNQFFLNDLNFYINDFDLPEENKSLKVKFCNCTLNNLQLGEKEYEVFESVYVNLNRKNNWYNVKLDTNHTTMINSNCIFIQFELMEKLTIKDTLLEKRNNYRVEFGQTLKSKNVTSYFEALGLDFDLGQHWGWHKTNPLVQKVFINVNVLSK